MPETDILLTHLNAIYGAEIAGPTYEQLTVLLERFSFLRNLPKRSSEVGKLTERDAVLITYGDQVKETGSTPLQTLASFSENYLTGVVSTIHILPFFPYSSDDGFSVIDYRKVDPALGSWEDIARINRSFRLMFDAVINHISAKSEWFQGFLKDDPKYQQYCIHVEGTPDLKQVVRPRALPLLSTFQTPSGTKTVWTTFSDDQIDLNYQNPAVLLEIIDLLLFYVSQGAEFIRLDAIAYLWKERGTVCIHLPQTHRIIQLFRSVLDQVAPYVFIITETNVPHQENISYFGDGTNEAQLVYNFALPPLVLHTLLKGDARTLTEWAKNLILPSDQVTFFNFLASHDGIGLNPARGILTEDEIDNLVSTVLEHSGLISYKHNPDGSQSPYEMNINYFDALSNPKSGEPIAIQIDRFIAAHAIMFSIIGLPAIYFHSLFGSRSWLEGVAATGRNRTINRQKLSMAELEKDLSSAQSLRSQVYRRLSRLLGIRAGQPAFNPHSAQNVLSLSPGVFAVLRTPAVQGNKVLCLQNVTDQQQTIQMDDVEKYTSQEEVKDLLSGRVMYSTKERHGQIYLDSYQTLWLA